MPQRINPGQTRSYAFQAYLTSNQTLATAGTDYLLELTTKLYDYDNVFNTATKRWVAPKTGVAHFDLALHLGTNNNYTVEIRLYKNGAIYSYGARGDASGFSTVTQGIDVPVVAGDIIEFSGQSNTNGAVIQGGLPVATYMSGYMIY